MTSDSLVPTSVTEEPAASIFRTKMDFCECVRCHNTEDHSLIFTVVETFGFLKHEKFLDQLTNYSLLLVYNYPAP
jgi:hypothetical protein